VLTTGCPNVDPIYFWRITTKLCCVSLGDDLDDFFKKNKKHERWNSEIGLTFESYVYLESKNMKVKIP